MTSRGSIAVPVIRFATEVVVVIVVPLAAAHLVDGTAASLAMLLLGAVVVLGAWGAWVAPRSANRLADPARLVVEVLVFLAAALAFGELGHAVVGAAVFVVAVVDAVLTRRIEPHPALAGEPAASR